MRFFIVFLILSTLIFGIEGRGLEPKKDPQPQMEAPETSTPPEEVRKASSVKTISHPDFKVTKVHEVRTDKKVDSKGNQALEFEQKYWMFGAVTEEQKESKKGQYFVITWVNKGAPRNIEARLEYRQIKTKDIVRTFSLRHPMAEGANRSQFSVIGSAFKEGGEIQSWRFTLWSGDELLTESKSFIW